MKVRLTAEQAIFAGLMLVAALMRVWNLGSIPLQPDETVTAVQSWSMYRGLPSTVEFGPVITYGSALIFSVLGANDASVRIVPVLAGCILVGLCYFSRPYIGRHAAIAGALLLALSPTSVFYSRFVGSELITATAALGSAILFFRYLGGRGPVYLYGFAVVVGIAISAGVTAFVNLVILMVFVGLLWLVQRLVRHKRLPGLASDREATDGGLPTVALNWDGQVVRNAALAFGATVLLVATGMFSNLQGVQEGVIGPLFQLAFPFASLSIQSPAYYVQILFVYETVVIAFAFLYVLYSTRPKGLFSWFLIWWAFSSLVFYSLMPQKSALLVIQPLVPVALLAGELIGELVAWVESKWTFARLLQHLGVLAAVTLPPMLFTIFLLNRFSLPGESTPRAFAIVSLLVLALAIAGFFWWRGAAEASRLGGVYLFVLLLAFYVHVGSNLNFRGEISPAEVLVSSVTVEDVRNLAADVSELERFGGDREAGKGIFVESRYQYPLAWYLKGNDGVEYAATPSENPAIAVTRENVVVGPGQRASQRYLVLSSWEPRQLSAAALWRWLVYREPSGQVRYDTAEVSVRR